MPPAAPPPTADHRAAPNTRYDAASNKAHAGHGNRNAGLFWAANRALEADYSADLSPLAAAARQAGLDDAEIDRTLDSARRTTPGLPKPLDLEAEEGR